MAEGAPVRLKKKCVCVPVCVHGQRNTNGFAQWVYANGDITILVSVSVCFFLLVSLCVCSSSAQYVLRTEG